ncbi:hypothetical protein [Streptomyces sp. VB1]|uniref:hypothetical protein n=1 Tax=Streptomyces sp. VB1 TaxID=2986803 RepID=UPI0022425EBD|nr:hypothetical protein [Streptomyces sp. VB1]UZI29163.1 hypothetical protein OH133_14000 [Streptomyces sp. VB1]
MADPYEGHSPLVLVIIILVGGLVAGVLGVYACTTLARNGVRRTGNPALLRSVSALAAAGAVGLFVWGALHLITLDETRRDLACKTAVGPERAMQIDGYRATYIPLGLGCQVRDGATYQAGVPGYLNPAAGALAFVAVVLGGYAALESERRLTKEYKRKTGNP